MTDYKPTGKMLPQSERETITFSGVDHMAAVAKARAAGEPIPPDSDPLRSGPDPFRAAFLNRIQEN